MASNRNKALPPLTWSAVEVYPAKETGLGVPGIKRRVPFKDIYILGVQLLGPTVGALTIFWSQFAIYLGQITQLIVFGLLLTVQAMFLEGQILRLALTRLTSRKDATLQDMDALLRKDPWAPRAHYLYRIILVLMFCLPLGLSASYKTFIGGQSTMITEFGDGFFGFSSTPGKQRIGDGLSILSDIYVPFWIDPAINRTYGFNMYIIDNNTAAILDTPYPSYLTSLQSLLHNQETFTLTATVNATVAEMVNPTPQQRVSNEYWANVRSAFGSDNTTNGGVMGAYNALWAGFGSNFSVAYFSAWNTTKNETFESEAIRTELTRRLAKGTWVISASDIKLTGATLVGNSVQSNQVLLQNNFLGLQEMFSNFLGEYDWHNRAGAFEFPYPSPVNVSARYYQPVNTVPALSATMAWARITSLDTIDRPQGIQSAMLRTLTGYVKSGTDIVTTKTVPTLPRNPLLILILLVNPVISLSCLVLRILFYHNPMGDDFNLISLLATARNSDLSILRGASLSGRLKQKVPITFRVHNDDGDDIGNYKYISMTLDGVSGFGRIEDGVTYR